MTKGDKNKPQLATKSRKHKELQPQSSQSQGLLTERTQRELRIKKLELRKNKQRIKSNHQVPKIRRKELVVKWEKWGRRGKLEVRTHNTEHRTQNAEHRTQNTERRTQNTEGRTQNTEHRTQNTEGG